LFGLDNARFMEDAGAGADVIAEFNQLRRIRNEAVHGQLERTALTPDLVARLVRLAEKLEFLKRPSG